MKRPPVLFGTLVFLATLTATSQISAQLRNAFPFKRRVSADPAANLNLTRDHGPWLINCASFVGERGEQQARQLALELRRDHNLEAYIYRHKFDYSNTVRGLGWEPYKTASGEDGIRPVRMKAMHSDVFEEIAVVVGNFASVDDAKAQDTIDKIKYLRPRALEVSSHIETNQRMGVWREAQRHIANIANINSDMRAKGPMRASFLMTNPLLPPEYFAGSRIDKFVLKLNKGVPYGLLDCDGRYSVRVATFRGDITYNSREIDAKADDQRRKLRSGQTETNSELARAAEKAHTLCVELRKMGVEAYEFHDRFESFVCVGSFDWATRKLPNGRDELNPEVAKVIKEYKARTEQIPRMPVAIRPRTINSLKGTGIYFDAQPLPVVVPKLHVSVRH